MPPMPRPASLHTFASPWRDTPQRYGRVSRWLHWGMALLLAWQFAGMVAKVSLGRDAALASTLSAAHAHVGLLLLVLMVVRAVWGMLNMGQRPPHGEGFKGVAVWAGHISLYALMLVVPLLAALRMLGNDRPFSWWGVWVLNDGSGEKVQWMVAPANAAHGLLGWTLLALIAGHFVMVLVHHWVWKDDVPQRMIGPVK